MNRRSVPPDARHALAVPGVLRLPCRAGKCSAEAHGETGTLRETMLSEANTMHSPEEADLAATPSMWN